MFATSVIIAAKNVMMYKIAAVILARQIPTLLLIMINAKICSRTILPFASPIIYAMNQNVLNNYTFNYQRLIHRILNIPLLQIV